MAVPGTHAPASSPVLVTAFVAKAPTSPSGELLVRIPEFGNALSVVFAWTPRSVLPALGDECLVAYDEKGNPWVAAWLSTPSSPTLVSALPSAPYDGQEVYFQNAAMATLGVIWHLRYRAASASAHKWEFVGGSETYGFGGDVTTGAGVSTYVALTGGPTFTLPLAGEYLIDASAVIISTASTGALCTAFVDAAETSTIAYESMSGSQELIARARPVWYGAAAGGVVALKVRSTTATACRFVNCTLNVCPIRVG